MSTRQSREAAFTAFVQKVEPRLTFAFAAAYGPDVGRDATAEALTYAWEHWERIEQMENPSGYLYRVGQTRSRRHRRSMQVAPPLPPNRNDLWIEPALPQALASLSEQQRTVVVLIHGFEWTQHEVAELLGIGRSTVQKHLERGLKKMKQELEVPTDA